MLSKSVFFFETSLEVQWLRLQAPNALAVGLIPSRGIRSCMLHSVAEKKMWKNFILHKSHFVSPSSTRSLTFFHSIKKIS